jgi:hypothetical protein
MKRIATSIFLVLLLPGCVALVEKTPISTLLPSEIPTSTTAEIPASVVTDTSGGLFIEVDGVKIPDPKISNPELFNLTSSDSPIVQLADAFGVQPEEVGNLTPHLLTGVDGIQFVVLTTRDLSVTTTFDESGIPLFIAEQGEDGKWEWKATSLKILCKLNRIRCGSTVNMSENYRSPGYKQRIIKDFSIIAGESTSPNAIDNWNGLAFANEYSSFAQKNGISFRPGHLFFRAFHLEPPYSDLKSASPEVIKKWMSDRVDLYLNNIPYFDSVVFANEPVSVYNGIEFWDTDNPYYVAYGENWPVEAYALVYQKLLDRGLKPGEDVRLIINLAYFVKEFGYKPEQTIQFVSKLKDDLRKRLGQSVPLDVGIQFHLRDVPPEQVDWGGPHVNDLNLNDLVDFFQRLGEVGDVHITEFSVKNIKDPELRRKGVNLIFTSAIQSGKVIDIIFWEGFQDNKWFLFNGDFQNQPDYYLLLKTLLSSLEQH